MKKAPYYRYNGSCYNNNYQLTLETYKVVGETEKGVYVAFDEHEFYKRHLIIHDWRKKFAYPTKAEALQGFVARKERQLAILESQLKAAHAYLEIAKDGDTMATIKTSSRWLNFE